MAWGDTSNADFQPIIRHIRERGQDEDFTVKELATEMGWERVRVSPYITENRGTIFRRVSYGRYRLRDDSEYYEQPPPTPAHGTGERISEPDTTNARSTRKKTRKRNEATGTAAKRRTTSQHNSPKRKRDKPQINVDHEFIEGAATLIVVESKKRHRAARDAAIQSKKLSCEVCGFNFRKTFGEIGDGFIHVHHNKPMKEVSDKRIVDPIQDLDIVCPNCHAMLHRQDPPFSVTQLKKIREEQRDKRRKKRKKKN